METAVDCLLEMPDQDRDERMLGSAYTNLTSCLTMLHQYPAAEAAWKEAQRYTCSLGQMQRPLFCMRRWGMRKRWPHTWSARRKLSGVAQHAREMTRQILSGTHPAFPVKMKRKIKTSG